MNNNDMNCEGVQSQKVELIKFFEEKRKICDIGCGITVPYKSLLLSRNPKLIDFIDNRFERSWKEGRCRYISEDMMEFLSNKIINRSIEKPYHYIWASEILEHLKPEKQKILYTLIVESSEYYIITFPTIEHVNFHNDWGHHPVTIPHYAYRVDRENWEGLITNMVDIIKFVTKKYPTRYISNPVIMPSRARVKKGLDINYK